MIGTRGFVVRVALAGVALCAFASPAAAQKIYLNPSDQTSNPVTGGGNEAQYALDNANLAKPILEAAGFTVRVDQDFTNAPANANSWGAEVFVSIHTNAGGGHGTETLYLSSGGQVLAGHVQDGLLSTLPYQSRGLKLRTDLHVLNATNMIACLTEALFHDCAAAAGYQGHPPSETDFLHSADGRQKIASGIAQGVCTHFGKSCAGTPPPQKGWYKGVVYITPNLTDVIDGALVQVQGGPSLTTTTDGAFQFELDPGTYTVSASRTGYQSGSTTRDVLAGQDVWGNIGLAPDSLPDAGPDALEDARGEDASDGATDAAVPDSAGGFSPTRTHAPREPSGCACRTGASAPNCKTAWLAIFAGFVALSAARCRRRAV